MFIDVQEALIIREYLGFVNVHVHGHVRSSRYQGSRFYGSVVSEHITQHLRLHCCFLLSSFVPTWAINGQVIQATFKHLNQFAFSFTTNKIGLNRHLVGPTAPSSPSRLRKTHQTNQTASEDADSSMLAIAGRIVGNTRYSTVPASRPLEVLEAKCSTIFVPRFLKSTNVSSESW